MSGLMIMQMINRPLNVVKRLAYSVVIVVSSQKRKYASDSATL